MCGADGMVPSDFAISIPCEVHGLKPSKLTTGPQYHVIRADHQARAGLTMYRACASVG